MHARPPGAVRRAGPLLPIYDRNPRRTRAIVTLLLIATNVGVFLFWQPRTDPQREAEFLYSHAVIACEVTSGEPLTFAEINLGRCGIESSGPAGAEAFPGKHVRAAGLVSIFLHAGWFHLLSNMWFLWLFGNNIEEAYGHLRYLVMYLVAGIVATLGFVALNAQDTAPLVGASGAIAGILGAYLVLYPTRYVFSWVFIYVLPVPAAIFLGLWFFTQFLVANEGVAWEAHVTGFVFGAALTFALRAPLNRRLALLHGRPA